MPYSVSLVWKCLLFFFSTVSICSKALHSAANFYIEKRTLELSGYFQGTLLNFQEMQASESQAILTVGQRAR